MLNERLFFSGTPHCLGRLWKDASLKVWPILLCPPTLRVEPHNALAPVRLKAPRQVSRRFLSSIRLAKEPGKRTEPFRKQGEAVGAVRFARFPMSTERLFAVSAREDQPQGRNNVPAQQAGTAEQLADLLLGGETKRGLKEVRTILSDDRLRAILKTLPPWALPNAMSWLSEQSAQEGYLGIVFDERWGSAITVTKQDESTFDIGIDQKGHGSTWRVIFRGNTVESATCTWQRMSS